MLQARNTVLVDQQFVTNALDQFKLQLGIPVNMFTPMFAIARTVGWVAHWSEMVSEPGGLKIGRPRQVYVGADTRDYKSIGSR